jgi:hypothetical protein
MLSPIAPVSVMGAPLFASPLLATGFVTELAMRAFGGEALTTMQTGPLVEEGRNGRKIPVLLFSLGRDQMANIAQRDQVLGRVVKRNPKRSNVVNVQRAAVFLWRLPAMLTDFISGTNRCCYLIPIDPISTRSLHVQAERLGALPSSALHVLPVETKRLGSRTVPSVLADPHRTTTTAVTLDEFTVTPMLRGKNGLRFLSVSHASDAASSCFKCTSTIAARFALPFKAWDNIKGLLTDKTRQRGVCDLPHALSTAMNPRTGVTAHTFALGDGRPAVLTRWRIRRASLNGLLFAVARLATNGVLVRQLLPAVNAKGESGRLLAHSDDLHTGRLGCRWTGLLTQARSFLLPVSLPKMA